MVVPVKKAPGVKVGCYRYFPPDCSAFGAGSNSGGVR